MLLNVYVCSSTISFVGGHIVISSSEVRYLSRHVEEMKLRKFESPMILLCSPQCL